MDELLAEMLKQILPTSQEPVIFKNMLQNSGSHEWSLLKWNISDFINVFGKKKLPFRKGHYNKRTCNFQHEQCDIKPLTKPTQLTFEEFVNKIDRLDDTWLYCDYKHISEWFSDNSELIESFNWLNFGIDESIGKNGLHSTIWIGSQGAHTDCHRDSYGYNLVAQVFGSKLWLLYPPNDDLIPVRIPYEESTVYSKLNMYCLSHEEESYLLKNIPHKPKLIVLEPGDVLLVPNGWWHYVECLSPINISLNIWGTLETDDKARVEESLVQLMIAKITNRPITDDSIANSMTDEYYFSQQVENAIIEYKKKEDYLKLKLDIEMRSTKTELNPVVWTVKDVIHMFPNKVKLLKDADQEEFETFLRENRARNERRARQLDKQKNLQNIPFCSFLEDIINALCHPNVINKATKVMLERFT